MALWLVPMRTLGNDAWKIAAALMGRHIGGGNFTNLQEPANQFKLLNILCNTNDFRSTASPIHTIIVNMFSPSQITGSSV